MNRDELEMIGLQLPVLPVLALGALPGEPEWAGRLAALGLDVVQSGAEVDSVETVAAARAAAPWSVLKARPGPSQELVAAGARLLETRDAVPAGSARLALDDSALVGIDSTSASVEDPNDIAAAIVQVAWERSPAELWVAAPPGLDQLPRAVVEEKLTVLVEGARQARLAIAKVQFEDEGFWNDVRPPPALS